MSGKNEGIEHTMSRINTLSDFIEDNLDEFLTDKEIFKLDAQINKLKDLLVSFQDKL